VIIGLARGKGELLMRNLRLCKSIDPNLLKKTVFIDIAKYANQSFDDKTANDGKGGWADLGASNLSLMQNGLRDFNTELFKVGTSCIMLGKGGKARLPLISKDIMINEQLKKLNFLSTALYVKAKPGESIGTCVVNYADGSRKEIPFVRGENIDDWYPPAIGKKVRIAEKVCLSGDGERATFIAGWDNPYPDKKIKSLTLKSNGNAIWTIIAISGIKAEKNLLKSREFTQSGGWRVWVSPKASKAGATVKLDTTAKVHCPSEKMHSSNIQMTCPVVLKAGTYKLNVTIDSDSEDKLSGTYGLAKAPYTSYCSFSIPLKKGKHTYTAKIRIQADPDAKCVLRLCPGDLQNTSLEMSDISIVQ